MDLTYKENVEHGSVLAPIQSYEIAREEECFFISHHWHEELEIIYIEEGEYEIVQNMESQRLQAGSISFVGCGKMHQLEGLTTKSRHYAIVFNLKMLSFELFDESQSSIMKPLLHGEYQFPSVILKEGSLGDEIYHEFMAVIRAVREKKQGWLLLCKVSLLKIIAILEEGGLFEKVNSPVQKEHSYKINLLKKVVTYVEENYKEKIYIRDLAQLINMNEQYFCRFFKKITGKTPVEYINRYRMEQATQRLVETDKKIMEICFECGFENFSYFIKKFKEYKKVTPNEYRKQGNG